MTLAEALADRVRSLTRTNERLRALDDQTGDHVVQEPDAGVVLRQALDVLTSQDGLDAARGLLSGQSVTDLDELARSGLAVWDPASGSLRASALLVELMKELDP